MEPTTLRKGLAPTRPPESRRFPQLAPTPPLPITGRWTGLSNGLRVRLARRFNRAETARRIEALLRQTGAAVAYDVFEHRFDLGVYNTRAASEYPDITLVIGDAEFELFFVAQRERGALGHVSVHESIHDAADDLIRRATESVGRLSLSGIIVFDSLAT